MRTDKGTAGIASGPAPVSVHRTGRLPGTNNSMPEKIAVGRRGMIYVGTARGLRAYIAKIEARRQARAAEAAAAAK